jgi:predicted nicotinamide N-methyase
MAPPSHQQLRALWKSELLLAEWILRELSGTIATPITEDQPVVVVELGCGACPAAGMVAAAMGAITIMTDRTEVVKLAEVNIRRNIHTISKIATRKNNTGKKLQQQQQQQQTTTIPLPPSSPKPLVKLLGRNSIDTAVYEWGDATTIPDRISSLAAIDVILIGDCIFSNTTHKKLLQSIARLHLIPFKYQNQYNHPKIIMAYQQRTNGTEVMDFFRMANKDFGFRTIPIENASELKNKLDGSTVGLEICQLVSS